MAGQVFRVSGGDADMRSRTRYVFRSPLLRATAALIHNTSAPVQGKVAGGSIHQTKDGFFHSDTAIHQSGHKANRVHCNYIADFCITGSVRQLQSAETLSRHADMCTVSECGRLCGRSLSDQTPLFRQTSSSLVRSPG